MAASDRRNPTAVIEAAWSPYPACSETTDLSLVASIGVLHDVIIINFIFFPPSVVKIPRVKNKVKNWF